MIDDVAYVRHRGTFTLAEDLSVSSDPGVSQLFASMRVLATDYDQFSGTIRYLALSPMFDAMQFGETVPEYSIEFTDSGITAKRL